MESEIVPRSSNRVLVIGLDGATWDLLDSWAAQGLLPNIQRLRSGGAWGPLRTTLPPLTPSAWSSMYTGTNPGKHGIFGFNERRKDGYRLSPVHSSDRRTKTLFRILSDAGMRVGVLNAPATYPPEAINGIFVPGIPVPAAAPDYTHPPEFAADLQAVTQDKHKYEPGGAEGHEEEFLEECDEYSEAVTSATALMMDRLGDWDFFMVQFQATDSVQHAFWHYLDPEHPKHDPDAPEILRNAILDRYRAVDRCLSEILRRAGEGADVLVVSDHGAGPFHEQIHLNVWLWRQGWLKFRRSPVTLFRRLFYNLGVTPESVRRQLLGRAPGAVRKGVLARRYSVLALADRFFLSLEDVDWERTRAYSHGGMMGSIYLNLKGREPRGCVPKEDYESVLSQLEAELRRMRHPLSGEPLIEEVLRSSDIYEGPFSKQGPDLQLLTRDSKYYSAGFLQFVSKRWLGPPWTHWSGHHSLDGMLLMAGPDAKQGVRIDHAQIVDIAPTVLALLGQPIPDWMDGKVLADGLKAEFLERSPPKTVHDQEFTSEAESAGYTAEDEAQIAKRLADLGYIE